MPYLPRTLRRSIPVLAALALATPAMAITLVTSRAALNANESTNFASLIPSGISLSAPSLSYTTSSGLGIALDSSDNAADMTVRVNPTFPRDFLSTQTQVSSTRSDTINIAFSSAIRGAGTQVTHPHQGPYLTRITAYNAAGSNLGSFDLSGVENNAADGSALYIGVADTNPTIARISLEVFEGTAVTTNPSNQDTVLLTDLNLLTGQGPGGQNPPPDNGTPPGAVPEPAALGLLGVFAGALICARRLRR